MRDYGRMVRADGQRQALGESVISAYTRPFDKDRRGVNLGPEWPGYEREDWREQHAKLISLRHSFVSHSEREARRVIVRSVGEGGWRTSLDLPPLFMLPGEAERTDAMCRNLLDRLHQEMGVACRTLIERERTLRPGDVEVLIPRRPKGSK